MKKCKTIEDGIASSIGVTRKGAISSIPTRDEIIKHS